MDSTYETRTVPADVSETVLGAFYINNLIKSVDTKDAPVLLVHKVRSLLKEHGFNQTSFTSNLQKFLNSLPVNSILKLLRVMDFNNLPILCIVHGELGKTN